MRVLADTSVLVPALVEAHEHHARASPTLDRAASGEVDLVVAAHALAETYATLTALRPRLTPTAVLDLIQEGRSGSPRSSRSAPTTTGPSSTGRRRSAS